MITRDLAAPLLRPLAEPTTTAFATARRLVAPQQKGLGEVADKMDTAILNTMTGGYFWGPFATLTAIAYEAISGVERQVTKSPLEHVWLLRGGIVLRMKSEIDQLSNEQLTLETGETGKTAEMVEPPSLVVLTWQHLGSERHTPVFVGMDQRKAVWNLSLEALIKGEAELEAVRPEPAKAVVKLTKGESAERRDEQQS
jgi:hypothetical protein